MSKKTSKIRTFKRETVGKYREIVQINEVADIIKIYTQDKEIGFPFSEYISSLRNFGYNSADEYIRSMQKREKENIHRTCTEEIDTDTQIKSEIDGFFNLANYRKERGKSYADIVGSLKAYGLTEQEILKRL